MVFWKSGGKLDWSTIEKTRPAFWSDTGVCRPVFYSDDYGGPGQLSYSR